MRGWSQVIKVAIETHRHGPNNSVTSAVGTDWACCLPAHLQRRLHGLADANHNSLPRGTESSVMKRALTSNWNALVNLCRVAAGKYEH